MRPVISSQEMAWVDSASMRARSITSFELMKEVAQQMAEVILAKYSSTDEFLVLCGPGNNGGDAYCVAELLRRHKRRVWILPLDSPNSVECRKAAKACRVKKWSRKEIPSHLIVIDGVFGSGQRAHLNPELRKLFKQVAKNRSLSLDIPTGISDEFVDSGAFRADFSLVVAYPKRSLLLQEAAPFYGKLSFVGQNFARPRFFEAELIEETDFSIPEMKLTAHKSGRVGVLAGSAQTPGAAFLTAEAAHRMGVGYVHLFFAKASHFKMSLERASFLFEFRPKLSSILRISPEVNAWVLGPGGYSKSLASQIAKSKAPKILDAEALPFFGQFKSTKNKCLTPHPGEASKLLRCKLSELQKSRIAALGELQRKTQSWVYLKGAPGLLMSNERRLFLNYSVQPVLARAGSGDVLSGILGGAVARCLDFERGLLSGLLFQAKMAEILSETPAAMASDQLQVFSKTWRAFWKRPM